MPGVMFGLEQFSRHAMSASQQCRVAAIRNQITNTAKQFANIKNVIISINGETELILQP